MAVGEYDLKYPGKEIDERLEAVGSETDRGNPDGSLFARVKDLSERAGAIALPDWRGFTSATTSEELAKVGGLIISTGKAYVTVCVDNGTTQGRDNGCAPTQIRIVAGGSAGNNTTELYLEMDYNDMHYTCKITKTEGIVGEAPTYSTDGTESSAETINVKMTTEEI